MKRELTWKRIFLTILGAVLLVVAVGLAATLSIGHKTSTVAPIPVHASLLGEPSHDAGISPSGSGWALTTAGLELIPDGGNSFTFVPYPIPVLNISDVVIKGPHIIVAGVINFLPVLKSSNDVGATWKSVTLPAGSGNAGFARFVTQNGTLIGMLVDDVVPLPRAMAEWYATSDGGATWTHHSIPGGGVVTAVGGDLWLAGGPQFASLYKSADLGVTWSKVSTPSATINNNVGAALSVPGQLENGNVVLVASGVSESLTPIFWANVYVSNDLGTHWKVLARTNFVGNIGAGVPVATSVVANSVWLGGMTDQGIAVISTKGTLTRTSSMRALYPGGWITSIMPFGNSSAWVTTVNGKCPSGKSSCREVSALIGTVNAGKTWSLVDKVASTSSIVPKSWAELGAEQLAALPIGTQIVNCTPTQKQMQPGVTSTPADGSPQLDPGFHFLIDGRCAFDPSALPKPMRVDWVGSSQPLDAAWWWTPITAVELSSLPAGTQIVNCWGKIKQLPRGVRLEVGLHFSKEHSGFYFLTDGRCALDPNALPTPLRSGGANGGAPDTSTKAFDLQWFGTGLDGGPAIGGSTCFVGDALNNHCGIETNLSTGPRMMSTGGPLPPKPTAR